LSALECHLGKKRGKYCTIEPRECELFFVLFSPFYIRRRPVFLKILQSRQAHFSYPYWPDLYKSLSWSDPRVRVFAGAVQRVGFRVCIEWQMSAGECVEIFFFLFRRWLRTGQWRPKGTVLTAGLPRASRKNNHFAGVHLSMFGARATTCQVLLTAGPCPLFRVESAVFDALNQHPFHRGLSLQTPGVRGLALFSKWHNSGVRSYRFYWVDRGVKPLRLVPK